MPTSQSTVDDLLDRLAAAGRVTARKMFGEYCLYLDEKPVALVCDDTLFVKPTAAGRELMPAAAEGPPYPGAKPHLMFPPDDWTDRERLGDLLRATAAELPRPKPKPREETPEEAVKDALWSAGGHLAALAWVATRAFAGTVFVSTAAGVVLGALSWAALWDRPWGWGLGMAALALAEGVAAGVFVGVKRAGILAAAHALGRLKLGGRLVRAVFDRILMVAESEEHGERGVLAAKGLERVPLARADALLTGAVKAVAGEGEGGWVRRKVRGVLLGVVQKYTAARFREEGAKHGGVDLVKVRDELEQAADAALLARVRGGLRVWTLALLLGLPAVVAVQTAVARYAAGGGTEPPAA